jgi:predicted membrane channel-forming protein YqfA (hemolysin III family)
LISSRTVGGKLALMTSKTRQRDNAHPGNVGFMEDVMNGIIYLVGLIVIIMAILTFLGLR